jgi:hypothetical protein
MYRAEILIGVLVFIFALILILDILMMRIEHKNWYLVRGSTDGRAVITRSVVRRCWHQFRLGFIRKSPYLQQVETFEGTFEMIETILLKDLSFEYLKGMALKEKQEN